MNYEDKKTLFISILMVFVLGFLTYGNLKRVSDIDVTGNSSFTELAEIELPPLDEITPMDLEKMMREHNLEMPNDLIDRGEDITYSSQTIPGVMSFDRPSHWEVSNTDINEEYKEVMEILFVSNSQSIDKPTFIIVSEIKGKDIPSNIEILKGIFFQEGIRMTITEEKEIDDSFYFEAEYLYNDGLITVSKEKMFIIDNRFYLFSIIVFREKSELYSPYMNQIIESIQIIN